MPEMNKKKSERKNKRMMPMSPRPIPRPKSMVSDEEARAVEAGNRSARHNADEYESLVENYRDGGMVRGCGPAQMSGKGFRGTF